MLIRKSSQGHYLRLYKNTTPGAVRTKTYSDGTKEALTYPSSYTYFLVKDGEVIQRSNSWATIEQAYVDQCDDNHGGGHGRIMAGKHHIINGVVTSQSDYPTDSNTKAEIKDFYDKRGITYSSSETKSELLSRIVPMMAGDNEVSKHLKV
tara:strand:- start:2189 stop:2638 length:450 start_codon:yes stop_codon:yes gene_type:complete